MPWIFWQPSNQNDHKVLIAAGQKSSQSYAIIRAIAQVVQHDFLLLK